MKLWVVGGSRGIGCGVGRAFLERNPSGMLWISARNSRTEESERMSEAFPGRVQFKDLDICDDKSIGRITKEIVSEGGNLTGILNTVGLLHDGGKSKGKPERRLKDIEVDWAMQNFAVNALGPLLLAKWAITENILDSKLENTFIVNLSAKVGSISDNKIGSWYSYRGSKAAQNMFNKCVAIEATRLKKNTVCFGIHPGTVDTSLSKPFTGSITHEVFSIEKASHQIYNLLFVSLNKETYHGNLVSYDGSIIQP